MYCPVGQKECSAELLGKNDNCYTYEGRNGIPPCVRSVQVIASDMHSESLTEDQAKTRNKKNAKLYNLDPIDLWLATYKLFING